MTRLPVESWQVRPRLDLPAYELNAACPVTGDTLGLENHHIFRASHTALGKEDNDRLYWVEYYGYPGEGYPDIAPRYIVKNRVALSPDAHLRITVNKARLEYRGEELWYLEDGEEKLLDLTLRLMAPSERVSRRRKKASTPEERRARVNYSVRTPPGEENVLPELADALREKFAPQFGWSDEVPSYYVWTAAAAAALQS